MFITNIDLQPCMKSFYILWLILTDVNIHCKTEYLYILFMILLYSISTIYQSKLNWIRVFTFVTYLNMNLRLAFLSYNVKECGKCSTITDTPKMSFLCTFVLICCLIMSPFVIHCLNTSITASQYTIALVSSFR